jgi:hypothetical protein
MTIDLDARNKPSKANILRMTLGYKKSIFCDSASLALDPAYLYAGSGAKFVARLERAGHRCTS